LLPAGQGASLAAGPPAAGFILGLGKGYSAVLLLAGLTTAMAAAAYALVHRYRDEVVPAVISFGHSD
jgi:hypothetical protein